MFFYSFTDRDKYVTIISENILTGHEHNFNKLTSSEVDSLGEPYDHNSIMHYARNTYSKNVYKDTILPKKIPGKRRRPEIGQRKHLSKSDIVQANKLYKCPTCGRTFQEHSASFSSPDYYTKTTIKQPIICEWRITTTRGEQIVLNITDLEIYKTIDCQSDYLEIRDGYWSKSSLLGRFCGRNENVTTVKSTGNRLLLTYKSSNIDFRGFSANYETVCGGNYTTELGNAIESPNYPLFYSSNKKCIWRITVPENYQVALEFHSFDLETHPNCVHDFIEVRDGDSEDSRLIGVYCGNRAPPILASKTNKMFIKFVSDGSGENTGFSATYFQEIDECKLKNHGCEQNCINTLEGYRCACRFGFQLHEDKKTCIVACGGIIKTMNGLISSPSFPNPYPINKICIWEIIAPEPYRITLNFTHFELEGSNLLQEECDYDSVTISSKQKDNKLKRQGVFCSERLPPSITSETNIMRIKFQSDATVQKTGFSAVFSTNVDSCAVNNGGCMHRCQNKFKSFKCSCDNGYILHENRRDCIPGDCKYNITATQGVITSENYPKNYSKNMNCLWHFVAMPGHRVNLEFEQFETEDDSECSNDFVAIFIAVDPSTRFHNTYLTGDVYTLGKFCGSTLPNPISSPSDGMSMTFKTDDSIQKRGFKAKHSTVCGGHFFATEEIKSIYSHAKYGDTYYDHDTDCDWIIQASQMWQRVHLVFHTFDVEDEQACSFDFVDIYDGKNDQDGSMYGRFCGTKLPLEIVSLRQTLLLRFRTDDTMRKKGFSLSYTIADATTIKEYGNSSPKFIRLSNNAVDLNYDQDDDILDEYY